MHILYLYFTTFSSSISLSPSLLCSSVNSYVYFESSFLYFPLCLFIRLYLCTLQESIPPSLTSLDPVQGTVNRPRPCVGDAVWVRYVRARYGSCVPGLSSPCAGLQLCPLSLRLDKIPALHSLREGKVPHHEQTWLRGGCHVGQDGGQDRYHIMNRHGCKLATMLSQGAAKVDTTS